METCIAKRGVFLCWFHPIAIDLSENQKVYGFWAFLSLAAPDKAGAARERNARFIRDARFPWVSPTAMNIQPLRG